MEKAFIRMNSITLGIMTRVIFGMVKGMEKFIKGLRRKNSSKDVEIQPKDKVAKELDAWSKELDQLNMEW